MTPFTNPAREDGLVLRHWRRKRDPNAAAQLTTPTDGTEIVPVPTGNQAPQTESDYYFAKFNVKVQGPQYDDSQYEKHLHSQDWSREETDYLVNLALDYDLRWVVIADRYDYQPTTTKDETEPNTALVAAAKKRTMEDIKARYYDVAAKIMALNRPVSSMSAAEFDLHEKMTKFNGQQETTRKQLADALLSRSLDEIKEEEILLGELKRIVSNEEKFLQERRELYDRLEAAPSTPGAFTMYQSSNELGELMKSLLNADKSKKRRLLLGPGDPAASGSPAIGSSGGQNFSGQRDGSHRDSVGGSSSTAAGIKKGSISGPSANATATRPLTAKEEAKYGISHHERLTSGVQFRHDRVVKLGQAKSNVQASKISGALTELGIPPRLVMPTARVCAEYERLIASIHTLLDVRKVSEKVEGEIRVCEAQREERERKERVESGEGPRTPVADREGEEAVPKVEEVEDEEMEDVGLEPKVEEPDDENQEEDDDDDDEEKEEKEEEDEVEPADEAADGENADGGDASASGAPSAQPGAGAGAGAEGGGHKRSASVMSNASEKGTKRLRK